MWGMNLLISIPPETNLKYFIFLMTRNIVNIIKNFLQYNIIYYRKL